MNIRPPCRVRSNLCDVPQVVLQSFDQTGVMGLTSYSKHQSDWCDQSYVMSLQVVFQKSINLVTLNPKTAQAVILDS